MGETILNLCDFRKMLKIGSMTTMRRIGGWNATFS